MVDRMPLNGLSDRLTIEWLSAKPNGQMEDNQSYSAETWAVGKRGACFLLSFGESTPEQERGGTGANIPCAPERNG